MKIAIAQIAPVVLDRAATLAKVAENVKEAADAGSKLIAFGETLVPAYPFWLSRTDAARFEAEDQKQLHALYVEQAIKIPIAGFALPPEEDHLAELRALAKDCQISIMLGVAERAIDRGSHTIYCSRVFISGEAPMAGEILSVHRKLVPTYEERLAWGAGDGAGLVTHRVGEFVVGGLNCWENWLPLARAALYAAGETIHVMLWPGDVRLTNDITRFVAKEGRCFVLSASGLIREQDIPADVPYRDQMLQQGETAYDGGSCVAGPDGHWIVEPQANTEQIIYADLDAQLVREERQNMDCVGHYARPDVLQVHVNRRRQSTVRFSDERSSDD